MPADESKINLNLQSYSQVMATQNKEEDPLVRAGTGELGTLPAEEHDKNYIYITSDVHTKTNLNLTVIQILDILKKIQCPITT